MTRSIPPGFARLADHEPSDSDREYWVAIPLRGGRWALKSAYWDEDTKSFFDLGDLPADVDIDLIWSEKYLMKQSDAEKLLGCGRE